jgi:aerobic C4-dicarboxylate transport protein
MTTSAPVEPQIRAIEPGKKPFYRSLYGQVLIAIVIGIVVGHFWPATGVAMKPLGDGFIKLIKTVIALVIFCTVTSGIAGMENLKRVGALGGKALLYFEIVSTLALAIGMIVGNVLQPGAGFNVDIKTLKTDEVMAYAGKVKDMNATEFFLGIIPNTFVDAFAKGDILPVLLMSILFGLALARMGERCRPIVVMLESFTTAVFAVVGFIMKFAPIGAFGAMAFTVGRYGIAALGPLLKLIATFYLTSALFVFIVLGIIARISGFSIVRFLLYIKEEILIVLGTSSSDPAIPTLIEKLVALGCSRPLAGLVVPTGYTFNTDGTSIYMTMAALFIAQATNIDLTLGQQLTIFAVAMLTSKGASGVTGAAFIALVATLNVVPTIPVAGMALILGIDRFMSEARAIVNMIGNGVATIVMARWEKELTYDQLAVLRSGGTPPAVPSLAGVGEH